LIEEGAIQVFSDPIRRFRREPILAAVGELQFDVVRFRLESEYEHASEQYTLARWFKGAPLALDEILTGGVKTYIVDSVIADSAPAGTAFATGFRTSDNFVGIGPQPGALRSDLEPSEDLRYRPLATVLEGARLRGKATGIVATSRVTHATPAAYVAHVPSRKLEEDIMEQLVYQNVDVVLGGGKDYLLPRPTQEGLSNSQQGKRRDGENLLTLLQTRGYAIVEDRAGLEAVASGRVFGTFAMGPMAAEIDRPQLAPQEPTLEEMTRKAIELLSPDPEGFFLMVEGSQIDWACHANDPAHLLSDLLMFDEAVQVALEFAKRDGRTLVLAFSDHNTGGMSIGNWGTNKSYSQMGIAELIGPLQRMKVSSPELWRRVCAPRDPKEVTPAQIDPQEVQKVVEACWGVSLTLNEARQLLEMAGQDLDNPHNAFGAMICPKWTSLGFTTHGHTGGDVPLFAFGPDRPVGLFDGPEIGKLTARALGLDLDALNHRLYVDVERALTDARVKVEVGESGNLVARIAMGETIAELPINKNLLLVAGQSIELEGVVVYIPDTQKTYVPLQAVQLIAGQQVSLPPIAGN
jgi:alkaline phosphatase